MVQEFVPFYGIWVARIFLPNLPFWTVIACVTFRARRLFDLLNYFHQMEVRAAIPGPLPLHSPGDVYFIHIAHPPLCPCS